MKNILFSLTFLISFTFALQAQENEKSDLTPIVLILDGSGSMWGQISGESKIAIARSVVGSLLEKMDPQQPISLYAYGHRRKSDCEDIEELIEAGRANREQIKEALKQINPVGKTPLANTALKVIEKLKASGERATIILVSDGAESCGGDLCAVVRAAKEAGLDFVLHIVGFDIGESDKLALECAAKAGEGLYLDAENGEELSSALEQASEIKIEEGKPSLSVKSAKMASCMMPRYKFSERGRRNPLVLRGPIFMKKLILPSFKYPQANITSKQFLLGLMLRKFGKKKLWCQKMK